MASLTTPPMIWVSHKSLICIHKWHIPILAHEGGGDVCRAKKKELLSTGKVTNRQSSKKGALDEVLNYFNISKTYWHLCGAGWIRTNVLHFCNRDLSTLTFICMASQGRGEIQPTFAYMSVHWTTPPGVIFGPKCLSQYDIVLRRIRSSVYLSDSSLFSGDYVVTCSMFLCDVWTTQGTSKGWFDSTKFGFYIRWSANKTHVQVVKAVKLERTTNSKNSSS